MARLPGSLDLVLSVVLCLVGCTPASDLSGLQTDAPDGLEQSQAELKLSPDCKDGSCISANELSIKFLASPPTATGSVTVTSASGSVTCTKSCKILFPENSFVSISAQASSPSEVVGVTVLPECSGTSAACDMLKMDKDREVTAEFRMQPLLSIAFNGTGRGRVAVSGSGTCNSECAAYFPTGTPITLTASPEPDNVFAGWHGECGRLGRWPTCDLVMNKDMLVQAAYTKVECTPGARRPCAVCLPVEDMLDPGLGTNVCGVANTWGTTCDGVSRVRLSLDSLSGIWGHDCGRGIIARDGSRYWEVTQGESPACWMQWGPYRGLPAGAYEVQFQGWVYTGTSPSVNMDFDVVNVSSRSVIGSSPKALPGGWFSVPVRFGIDGCTKLEFRALWKGQGTVRLHRTVIQPL